MSCTFQRNGWLEQEVTLDGALHIFLFLGFSNLNMQYTFLRLHDTTSSSSSSDLALCFEKEALSSPSEGKEGAARYRCAASIVWDSSRAEGTSRTSHSWALIQPKNGPSNASCHPPRIMTPWGQLERKMGATDLREGGGQNFPMMMNLTSHKIFQPFKYYVSSDDLHAED